MGERPRVLITGACGRIGCILMQGLAPAFELYALEVASPAHRPQAFRADVSNFEQLWAVFEQLRSLPYVVHLAADARVDADWQSVLVNNIHGTRNIYEAARRKGSVRRIVFASSNHVTGRYEFVGPGEGRNMCDMDQDMQISVRDAPRPDGYYGVSKLAGEAIARYFFDCHGIESICLRIGSVTEEPDGPREERHLSTWLSHRDLVHLVKRALVAGAGFPGFGIYYGVSDNRGRFWEIDNAREELGYHPRDDASHHWPS